MKLKKSILNTILAMGLVFSAQAQDKNMPGVTDKEIKIGATAPYSGPAAAYGIIYKVMDAYFKELNSNGGVNGRQINYITYDDAYNPAKTVEQTKKLVERDGVAYIGTALGTPNGLAVRKYLNDKKIPQLGQLSGAFLFNDPKNFPWSTPGLADYAGEAAIYVLYILEKMPNAKIAILYQNDDYGKLYLGTIKKVLGDKAKDMIVEEESYEVANPTIKAQMLKLQNSGADVFINISTPKQAIQSLQELKGSDWKPLHIMTLPAAIKDVVFKAVGFENAKDVITAAITKDTADPAWDNDEDVIEYKKFIKDTLGDKYDPNNVLVQVGYTAAKVIEKTVKEAGDDLSRENILKVATNLTYKVPLTLPGLEWRTTPDDYRPYKEMQLVQFDGKVWKPLGKPTKFPF